MLLDVPSCRGTFGTLMKLTQRFWHIDVDNDGSGPYPRLQMVVQHRLGTFSSREPASSNS